MTNSSDSGKPEDAGGDLAPGILSEYLSDDSGIFVRSRRQFERFHSPFQAVEVHDGLRAPLLDLQVHRADPADAGNQDRDRDRSVPGQSTQAPRRPRAPEAGARLTAMANC